MLISETKVIPKLVEIYKIGCTIKKCSIVKALMLNFCFYFMYQPIFIAKEVKLKAKKISSNQQTTKLV